MGGALGCGGEGWGGVVEGLRYEADLNMSCHGRESCLEFGSVYGTNSIFSDFKFLRRERGMAKYSSADADGFGYYSALSLREERDRRK